jgi:hypothetical protein
MTSTRSWQKIKTGYLWLPIPKSYTIKDLIPAKGTSTLIVPVGQVQKMNLGDDFLTAFSVVGRLLWGAAEPLWRILNIILNKKSPRSWKSENIRRKNSPPDRLKRSGGGISQVLHTMLRYKGQKACKVTSCLKMHWNLIPGRPGFSQVIIKRTQIVAGLSGRTDEG